jgi:RHS repeat-associated protein
LFLFAKAESHNNPTMLLYTRVLPSLKDEENNPSWVFTDKRGRTLLKRTYNSVGGTQAIGYYSTYYVYDDLDRLIYVLPPMAADALSGNGGPWNPYTTGTYQLSYYGYYYRYDDRGNCVEKKLPGVDPVFMVYDKADRLILTQDGNNRPKDRWLFTKYDVHGRPIVQGSVRLIGQTHSNLIDTYKSLLVTESYVGGASNYGYTNTVFQTVEKYMKVLYYDTYTFITGIGLHSYKAGGMSWNSSLALDPCWSTTNAKGLQTGEISLLLENTDYKSYNAFYYDKMGRLVQKVGTNLFNPSSNYTFGMDNYAYDYDFRGNLLHTRHRHRGSLAGTIFFEGSKHDYDHAGRVLTNKHYVTNESSIVTTSTMSYNELGQLTSKTRSKGYESQLFQYNIRGWLTRLGCEVFNEDLYYEKTSTGGQGCYNGNISQSRMKWMVVDLASDNWYMTEEYDYRSLLFNHTYDQLSRLTNTTSTDNDFSKFGEAMTYDKHGNIKTINRGGIHQHGWNYIYPNHTYGIIDNVTLSYEGNQLYNAIDLANDPLYLGLQDFKNYMTTYPGTEYRYDANGNLTDDSNKGIVTIRSNWLNLPDTVQMENGDMASYTYSPSGDKFMCIYSTANTSTVTMPLGTTLSNGRPAGITVAQSLFMLYMDNVVYEGNPWSTTLHNLGKVLTDDGILVRTNSVTQATPVFERNYYVRDHLGNVRVVFDSQGRVRQLNNYTPFGMEYGESAGNQASVGYQDYKFGGKELDRRFELNWYNFGARSYDLALGRWTSMDPLAEQMPSMSPYCYAANNPIRLIDIDGLAPGNPPGPGNYQASINLRYIGFGLRNTFAATRIGFGVTTGATNISTNATRFATRGEILNGSKRSQEDRGSENGAFRHGLWQATIASEFGGSVAAQAGNAHEKNAFTDLSIRNFSNNDLDGADQTVDLLNNAIGRSIGAANQGANMHELANFVLDKFKNNGLYTATMNKDGNWIVSKTTLSSEKYNQLKDIFKGLNENGRTAAEQQMFDTEAKKRLEELQQTWGTMK